MNGTSSSSSSSSSFTFGTSFSLSSSSSSGPAPLSLTEEGSFAKGVDVPEIFCLEVDSISNTLFTGHSDCLIREWRLDLPTPSFVRKFVGHTGPVAYLVVHDKVLFSLGKDRAVIKWDLNNGDILHKISLDGAGPEPIVPHIYLKISKDKLYAGPYQSDREMLEWDLKTNQTRSIVFESSFSIFSVSGDYVFISSSFMNKVSQRALSEPTKEIWNYQVQLGLRTTVVVVDNKLYYNDFSKLIELDYTNSSAAPRNVYNGLFTTWDVRGRQLVLANRGDLFVVNLETSTVHAQLFQGTKAVNYIAQTNDLILTASCDGMVKIWKIGTSPSTPPQSSFRNLFKSSGYSALAQGSTSSSSSPTPSSFLSSHPFSSSAFSSALASTSHFRGSSGSSLTSTLTSSDSLEPALKDLLHRLQLQSYESVFQREKILTIADSKRLCEADLISLGLKMGERKKLLEALGTLVPPSAQLSAMQGLVLAMKTLIKTFEEVSVGSPNSSLQTSLETSYSGSNTSLDPLSPRSTIRGSSFHNSSVNSSQNGVSGISANLSTSSSPSSTQSRTFGATPVVGISTSFPTPSTSSFVPSSKPSLGTDKKEAASISEENSLTSSSHIGLSPKKEAAEDKPRPRASSLSTKSTEPKQGKSVTFATNLVVSAPTSINVTATPTSPSSVNITPNPRISAEISSEPKPSFKPSPFGFSLGTSSSTPPGSPTLGSFHLRKEGSFRLSNDVAAEIKKEAKRQEESE